MKQIFKEGFAILILVFVLLMLLVGISKCNKVICNGFYYAGNCYTERDVKNLQELLGKVK